MKNRPGFPRYLLGAAAIVVCSGHAANAQTPTAPNLDSEPAPAPPTAATAQTQPTTRAETTGGLQEIIVTAQRRSERLQDVPIAITSLTADALATSGVSDAADLSLVVPSLSMTNGVGFSRPRIRGVGSSSSSGGQENSVATYIDGVYIASSSAAALSFNNIQDVSVLKGPQGTLFGRNATGGVIQITTRDPQQSFSGKGSITLGNRETVGASGYITGGLGPSAAADLAVYFNDQRDGFGTNLFNGDEVNKSRNLALRSKVKLNLSEGTTVRLAADYGDNKSTAPAYRPIYGSIPFTGVPFTGGKFDIAADGIPLFENKQGGGSITINQDVGSLNLVSITAYRESDTKINIDNDRQPVFANLTNIDQRDRQFSQEIQLLSSDSSMVRWVLGAYYFNISTSSTTILKRPSTIITVPMKNKGDSFAAFGQATVEVLPMLNVIAGLRYTTEERRFSGLGTVENGAGTALLASLPAVSGRQTSGKLTWRFALDYHFNPDLLAYASYNRGFKSGGFNPTRIELPLNPYRGEQLDAWELGLKGDFLERRLRVNTAIFYYDYKDIQIAANSGGVVNIANAASAKLYGLDLDVTAAVSPRFVLTAGLSLLHARFGDFPGATFTFPLVPNGSTILGGNLASVGNAKGNRLPNTPDWTLNLGAQYSIPLESGRIRLAANFAHNDGWYAEADNRLRQKAYDLFNANVAWHIGPDERYRIEVWGKNLGNVAYATNMSSAAPGDGVGIAPGRTFGITFGGEF